ncbi:MAG: glycosyltransferase family 9 protein [Verrucomicrobiota bacterium]
MKIVVARPDRIGDAVIGSSCLPAIADRYSHAELYYMVRGVMQPLFKHLDYLKSVLVYPGPGVGDYRQRVDKLCEVLKGVEPDIIIHLQPEDDLYEASAKAKISKRIGYLNHKSKLFQASWLTDFLEYNKYEGSKHESEYHFDLLKFIDVQQPNKLKGQIALSENDQERLNRKVTNKLEKNFVVINPTAFSSFLRWPVEWFAKVASWIIDEYGFQVVIIGGDREDEASLALRRLLKAYENSIFDLSGQLDLAELSCLLKSSKLHLSRNTGTSHLAAAIGCPLVDLHGRVESIYASARWAPLSDNMKVLQARGKRKWLESSKRYWQRTMKSISVAQVKQATKEILEENGLKSRR